MLSYLEREEHWVCPRVTVVQEHVSHSSRPTR